MIATQYIQSVLPGRPFGDGLHGALNISADTTFNVITQSCSGIIESNTLSLPFGTNFSNGDVILIYQTRGTGVGVWEINYIIAGGGGSTLTLLNSLSNTYTDDGTGGTSQAQCILVKRYTNITIDSGKTWSADFWNQNRYGLMVFTCNGQMNVDGSVSSIGKGFQAGSGVAAGWGYRGEGTVGPSVQVNEDPNGNGGGGGSSSSSAQAGSGGGGGNGVSGSTATAGSGETPGQGGNAVGNEALTNFCLGGAGGGAGRGDSVSGIPGDGGKGGGGIIGFIKILTVTGSIVLSGNNGINGTEEGGGGGGGAGGSGLFNCMTATFGTNLISAAKGVKGTGSVNSGNGGDGAVGRLRLNYSKSYSGSTNNPTISINQDLTLVESSYSSFFE